MNFIQGCAAGSLSKSCNVEPYCGLCRTELSYTIRLVKHPLMAVNGTKDPVSARFPGATKDPREVISDPKGRYYGI